MKVWFSEINGPLSFCCIVTRSQKLPSSAVLPTSVTPSVSVSKGCPDESVLKDLALSTIAIPICVSSESAVAP